MGVLLAGCASPPPSKAPGQEIELITTREPEATAQRMGIPLGPIASDDLMVDGFGIESGDYRELSDFRLEQREASGGIAAAWRRYVFLNDAADQVNVTVMVFRTANQQARRYLAQSLSPHPWSGGVYLSVRADESVGDVAIRFKAWVPEGSSDQGHLSSVHFCRRNVLVWLRNVQGERLDLMHLARAIDTRIQARPLVPSVEASSRAPIIEELKVDQAELRLSERDRVEGRFRAIDPAGLPLDFYMESAGGRLRGPRADRTFTFIPEDGATGRCTVLLVAYNSLNLATNRLVHLQVRRGD